MVNILDGNSEVGAHIRSILLFNLYKEFLTKAVTSGMLFSEILIFLNARTIYSELLSNTITMD